MRATGELAGKGKNDKEPEWDPTFEPLMKVILGKKGIKTKSASEASWLKPKRHFLEVVPSQSCAEAPNAFAWVLCAGCI